MAHECVERGVGDGGGVCRFAVAADDLEARLGQAGPIRLADDHHDTLATITWIVVTLVTKPEPETVLLEFYRRTRPAFGWGPIARLAPDVKPARDTASNLLCWISGCVFIYGALFGVGKLLFGDTVRGLAILAVATAAGAIIYRDLSRRGWASAIE